MSEPTVLRPRTIRVRQAERRLDLDFVDGTTGAVSFELLRVESPSAEVQGHGPSQKVTVAGKRAVGVLKVETVGNYAVRITFDDGHDTGIYSWPYLLKLTRDHDALMRAYLGALAEQGLSRD